MVNLKVEEAQGRDPSALEKAQKFWEEMDVLVGIPEDKSARKKDKNGQPGKITNVQLAYIHTHGVRRTAMRREMQPDIDKGTPYPLVLQAYIREHGSPNFQIPPRPFLEPAIEKDRDNIEGRLREATLAVLEGDTAQAEAILKTLGMETASAVQKYFEDGENGWPPNSPETIERKGSSLPLVDTGTLRKSITYVIEKGGSRRD